MTDNEIFEFKEMLFKKFSNEDVRFIEYKLLEVLKKRENALVKIDRNNDENLLRMFLMTKKSKNLSQLLYLIVIVLMLFYYYLIQ